MDVPTTYWRMVFSSVVVCAFFTIAACGAGDTDNNTPSNDTTNNQTEGDVTTITYARGNDTTGSVEALIEAFEEQHPNIRVEYQELPNDTGAQHDYYVTALSGQSPEFDVFMGDIVWPAEFAQAQYALELDRLIEADDIDMDEFFPGTVDSVTFNGRHWAMPMYTDAGLLYYRTDIVDNPPETWDELIEMAQTYQGEAGTQFGYLMQANQYEGMVTNAIEFIESYGGSVLDEEGNVVVNSPEAIRGIEKMVEIAQSDFVPRNILNFEEVETENAWISGQAVLARNWPYMQNSSNDETRSEVAGNVDFSLLPAGDAGSAATLGGWVAMINRYSENIDEAWEFVKFITGEEGQKISAIVGGLAPTREVLYDDEEIHEAAPLFGDEEFVDTMLNAVSRPVAPNYPEISEIMQIELSRALTGDITPEEAAENMEQRMENAMTAHLKDEPHVEEALPATSE